jgi:hypothetical protein
MEQGKKSINKKWIINDQIKKKNFLLFFFQFFLALYRLNKLNRFLNVLRSQ